MHAPQHFLNYFWKKGRPVGVRPCPLETGESYKILSDPYLKRFSVELYQTGKFTEIVYDSALFDFRLLHAEDLDSWQRNMIEESPETTRSFLRNMDDRIVLIEECHFQNNQCVGCTLFSPHGILIAEQKIFKTEFSDPYNGVVLFDRTGRPIVIKRYAIDEQGSFATLLEELWEHSSFNDVRS